MEMRTTTRRRRGLLRRRPSPAKGEAFIATYSFPHHIDRGVERKHPGLTSEQLALVQQGLREWLVCCAWRGGATLTMPSRVVDTAWHEFILDSAGYMDFCDHAYGEYLHHIPEGDEELYADHGQTETIHAWDRSTMGRERGESILWEFDERLEVPDPWGIGAAKRAAVRARYVSGGGGGGWFPADGNSGGDGGAGGDVGGGGGGGDAGGGGGGCGGGGCGGGGG